LTHSELITRFYTAFAAGDVEAMVSCYHPEIQFEDPAFGALSGKAAGNMWRMLLGRSKGGIQITFSNVWADDTRGGAHWEAIYQFGATGRAVHNKIQANFEFKEGKIFRHKDHFNLWKWTRMALGWKGYLLGWTSFMRHKIHAQTNGQLQAFMAKNSH
jgi:ketosteroid isomerase-like protein